MFVSFKAKSLVVGKIIYRNIYFETTNKKNTFQNLFRSNLSKFKNLKNLIQDHKITLKMKYNYRSENTYISNSNYILEGIQNRYLLTILNPQDKLHEVTTLLSQQQIWQYKLKGDTFIAQLVQKLRVQGTDKILHHIDPTDMEVIQMWDSHHLYYKNGIYAIVVHSYVDKSQDIYFRLRDQHKTKFLFNGDRYIQWLKSDIWANTYKYRNYSRKVDFSQEGQFPTLIIEKQKRYFLYQFQGKYLLNVVNSPEINHQLDINNIQQYKLFGIQYLLEQLVTKKKLKNKQIINTIYSKSYDYIFTQYRVDYYILQVFWGKYGQCTNHYLLTQHDIKKYRQFGQSYIQQLIPFVRYK